MHDRLGQQMTATTNSSLSRRYLFVLLLLVTLGVFTSSSYAQFPPSMAAAASQGGGPEFLGTGESRTGEYLVFKLQHRSANEARELFTQLLGTISGIHIVADVTQNQLLIQAPEEFRSAISELLQRIDRPGVSGPPRSPAKPNLSVKSYLCPEGIGQAIAERLKSHYPPESGVRVAFDIQSSRLLVVATAELQQAIEGLLRNWGALLEEGSVSSSPLRAERSSSPPNVPRTDALMPPQSPGSFAPIPPRPESAPQPSAPESPLASQAPVTVIIPRGAASGAMGGASAPSEQTYIRLNLLQANEAREQLEQLLGPRLTPTSPVQPAHGELSFRDLRGREVLFGFDAAGRGIWLRGAAPLVDQFSKLIRALDAQPMAEVQSRIIPLRRTRPEKIREVVEAYRHGRLPDETPKPDAPAAHPPEGAMHWSVPEAPSVQPAQYLAPLLRVTAPLVGEKAEPAPAPSFQPSQQGAFAWGESPQNDLSRMPAVPTWAVAQIPLNAQPPVGPPASSPGAISGQIAPGVQPDQPAAPPATVPPTPQPTYPAIADVEVETLPDLDVIILRGRQRDVEELTQIIAELERLSELTEPKIDIYRLRHVNCLSLARVISEVQTDLVGGKQGRVRITPLVKPNALLLVGWGEAVVAIKELIAKLDQPEAPSTQLRVFQLKRANANTARTTITGAFISRGGLSPEVQVTADLVTNSLIVRASPTDMREVELLIRQLEGESQVVLQTRLFKLKFTLATDLASTLQSAINTAVGGPLRKSAVLELLGIDKQKQEVLRSGLLTDVQFVPDPHTNSLLVTSPPESMELVAKLIEQLDSPTAIAQIKVFRVINGDATALAAVLRTLFPPQPAGAQLAGAEGETTLVPVRFSVDVRTNSIIATGSRGDLAIIEALLLRLDEEEVRQRINTIYRLRNSPATDVARSINEFLRTERQLQLAAPGVISPFQQIEAEVVVVPEPISNALIISATPRFFQDIMELVEKLDEQPPQVIIQVLIAEVELTDTDEFGVELGLQDSVLFDRSLLGNIRTTTQTFFDPISGQRTSSTETVIAATNDPGYNFNNQPLGNAGSAKALQNSDKIGTQALSHFSLGRLNSELGYGGLVLSASSENVSVLLRALQETRRVRVLARPHVMTLDNQPAFIQVGKRVPRIVGTRFDGRVQMNTVELEPVGLILAVTPRISPDGVVVMMVDAEKSELGPEQEGIPISITEGAVIRSPSVNVTTAQTTVSAAHGETIVIGGLITKNTIITRRRVPWLSDIPLLGQLFRYDSDRDRRSELLIILTPYVVRTPEDAERIKQLEAARMNWCIADVVDIYGPVGVVGEHVQNPFIEESPVIFPDLDPRGQKPYLPKNRGSKNPEVSSESATLPGPTVAPSLDSPLSPQDPIPPQGSSQMPVPNPALSSPLESASIAPSVWLSVEPTTDFANSDRRSIPAGRFAPEYNTNFNIEWFTPRSFPNCPIQATGTATT